MKWPFETRDGFSYGGTDAWNREHGRWLKRQKQKERLLVALFAVAIFVVWVICAAIYVEGFRVLSGIFWESYRNVGA